MNKKNDLRKRAEEKAANLPDDTKTLTPEQIKLTINELRVHQIELEMQNEELRRVQVELETARAVF